MKSQKVAMISEHFIELCDVKVLMLPLKLCRSTSFENIVLILGRVDISSRSAMSIVLRIVENVGQPLEFHRY